MEYNFYVEKPIDRDELHQSIIDILKELSNKNRSMMTTILLHVILF
ncbi:hypothetical protein Rumal_2727 [Ruminococcus albus 7 = DSM 20455]|uniref:Uncharacterized protein n=1 Tax=Ruminococcus albus (strain ATCC 27210 / DSM 20455 / JCM 14654 / NCDO 2250 / 7) TaxID=697329 RepID=E6UHB9_RUMA7|nr:hypothetical protein Rumal_2727 [Ruminococcus albus 7 = DSM 20455]